MNPDYGYAIEKTGFGCIGTIRLVNDEIVLNGNQNFQLMIRQSRCNLAAADFFLAVPEKFASYIHAVEYPVNKLPTPRSV